MKIKKYIEFLKEADEDEFDMDSEDAGSEDPGSEDPIDEEEKDYVSNDSPESYITSKLTNIKSKIDNMFSDGNTSDEEMTANSDDIDKKVESDDVVSFKDLGMNLESSEISKSTKTHKNLTVKFTDDEFYYSLLFKIDLKQVTGKKREEDEEMTTDMIKKSFIKFKKYSIDDGYKLLGEISKMVEISDIDEDFLVNLKIELDDEIGGNEDDFSIEYED